MQFLSQQEECFEPNLDSAVLIFYLQGFFFSLSRTLNECIPLLAHTLHE